MKKLIISFFAFLFAFIEFWPSSYNNKIVFLDVGAGDSILIRSRGLSILIDGGPGDTLVHRLSDVGFMRDPSFDLVFLTHFHEDHYSGVRELITKYEVKNLVVPKRCDLENLVKTFLDLEAKIPLVKVGTGDLFTVSDNLQIEILYPEIDENSVCVDNPASNENNNSLVLKVITPEQAFLLMGDVEKEIELLMLDRMSSELKGVDVLKAGHHCSRTSSSLAFLLTVQPKQAVCSTSSNNKYGHPSDEVIQRFDQMGLKIRATYIEGDIVYQLE